ncbi:MAG TPA: translation initiation factor IF-3 [Candidatus Mcinerneyibacterium sp.]|nr:translation initiation factor IF-3 [Candidatus Mcinerneyibacterium sp.]
MNVNDEIKTRKMRVIGNDGEQIGVLGRKEALLLAQEKELDLVEVAPNAKPPVAKIMDYGKFKYEQKKKQKKNMKKNKTQLKEIQFGPKTEEHDFNFKMRHIKRFLEKGHRVKIGVYFRGRELAYLDRGEEILNEIYEDLKDDVVLQKEIEKQGRLMFMIVAPKS